MNQKSADSRSSFIINRFYGADFNRYLFHSFLSLSSQKFKAKENQSANKEPFSLAVNSLFDKIMNEIPCYSYLSTQRRDENGGNTNLWRPRISRKMRAHQAESH